MIFQIFFKLNFIVLLLLNLNLIQAAENQLPGQVDEVELKEQIELTEEQKRKHEYFVSECCCGDLETVKRLLPNIVDINYQYNSETALGFTSYLGYEDIVELLLKTGANPNIKNINFWFPLKSGVHVNSKKVVELLLKYGANPNIVDNDGNTALKFAIYKAHEDIVELLLKCGANPNIKESLSYAQLYGNQKIIDLLKQYTEYYNKYYAEYEKVKHEITLEGIVGDVLESTDMPKVLCTMVAQYLVYPTFYDFVQCKLKEEEYNLKQQEELKEGELNNQEDGHKSKRWCVIS